jgi:hypothetical protein
MKVRQRDDFIARRISAVAEESSVRDAAAIFELGPDTLCYWMKKCKDPSFHSGKWDGKNYTKFTPEIQARYEATLLEEIKQARNSVTVGLGASLRKSQSRNKRESFDWRTPFTLPSSYMRSRRFLGQN